MSWDYTTNKVQDQENPKEELTQKDFPMVLWNCFFGVWQ